MKKNIYIPLEIFYREFSSKIHLSAIASLKNYRIYLGTKHGIDLLLDYKIRNNIKEGIFFYKSTFISNRKYLDKVKKICDYFVVLDEELGPALVTPQFAINNRCIFDERIEYFFVIGNNMKKKILDFDKRFKSRIKVVGWPKYDSFKKNKLKEFELESNKIKKKYGEFYLFSSNFGVLSKKGLIDKLKILKTAKLYKNYKDKKFDFQVNLKDLENLKVEINNYKSKIKLIIRPHPSEFYHEDWQDIAKENENENVKVIYDGEILPWILASKGLIHRGCTTAVDAHMINKPVFFWQSKRKLRKIEKNITFQISKKIDSLQNINLINSNIKKNITKEKLMNEIQNIYSKNSIEKILKYLDKLDTLKTKKLKFKDNELEIKKFIKKKIKKLFFKSQKMPKDFNIFEIKKLLKNFTGKNNFSVKKLHDHIIEIENN